MKNLGAYLRKLARLKQGGGDRVRAVRNSYRNVIRDHPEFIEDMARRCFMYSSTHVPGDPAASAFNEGQRQAYLAILEMAELTDAQIERILAEGRNAI